MDAPSYALTVAAMKIGLPFMAVWKIGIQGLKKLLGYV